MPTVCASVVGNVAILPVELRHDVGKTRHR